MQRGLPVPKQLQKITKTESVELQTIC